VETSQQWLVILESIRDRGLSWRWGAKMTE